MSIPKLSFLLTFLAGAVLGCGGGAATAPAGGNPCGNPCANPCGDNPCANPCGDNPCANPCGNPCGGAAAAPASAITQPASWAANTGDMSDADLLAKGQALWDDKSLSASGKMACQTCHGTDNMYKTSFAQPYPHPVEMAKKRLNLEQVTAAEMVQFCMVTPMKADALAWDSVELAALTRAVEKRAKDFAAK